LDSDQEVRVHVYAAVDFDRGIEDAWAKVATFVPKFLAFLAILIIGIFVAKAIAKIVGSVLERVGFDNVVERGGVKKALAKSKYDASDILGKIVYYVVFLFVLELAFGIFGPNAVSDLLTSVVAFLPKVFVAVVILIVAAAIAAAAKEIIEAAIGGLSYGKGLANAAAISIMVLAVFAALNQLEIAKDIVNMAFTGLVITAAGIAIVAIGGGGIQPMRARWEKALERMDEEKENIKQESQGASDRIKARAEQVSGQAKADVKGSSSTPAASNGGGATRTR